MTPSQTALAERFRGFCAKIDQRLRELMAEADVGMRGLIEQAPDDPIALGNAMSGLDHRVHQLKQHLDETWEQPISGMFMGEGGDFFDWGTDQKRDFEQSFDETWVAWKARSVVGFYRNLWPLAQRAMQAPVACTSCGAPLAIADRRKSVSVPCAGCRVVTQVIPAKPIATFFHGAPDAFAAEAALPLRFAVERYRLQVDRDRRRQRWPQESVASLDHWEAMERAYWERYAAVKAQVAGEPIDQELVTARLAQFRKFSLETEQHWRRAKGLTLSRGAAARWGRAGAAPCKR